MRSIRWGMIGCGDVAEVKSGPGFYKANNSELVAVMRRNGPLAEDFARRHNVKRWHDNADGILKAPDIDAVYIATLTDTHRDYVLRSASAGKAIYCEKPMGMNYAQCCEMIGAARLANVQLWIAYYRRALPRYKKLKDLLENGAVGKVRMVISRHTAPLDKADAWRVDPMRSGGGQFFETACHTLDSLDFLLGPIRDVRGFATNQAGAYQAEDTTIASYVFESGICGSGAWCYAADYSYEMNEIVGDAGRLMFSTIHPTPIRLCRGDSVEEFKVDDPSHVHQPLIQTIVDELNGVGKCPSTGVSAARTACVMDRLLSEYYPGRERLGG